MNNQISSESNGQGVSTPKPKKTLSPKVSAIIGVFSLVVGILFGSAVASEGFHDSKLLKTGSVAQGKVTKVDERNTTSGGRKHRTKKVVETIQATFQTPQGDYPRTVKGERTVRANIYRPTPMNSTVSVYYNPDKPGDNVISGWEANAFDGLYAGGIFIFASGVFFYGGISEKKRRKELTNVKSIDLSK
ncbi:MAG: DUF3592 domain-containing protein [Enterococcus sp.]|nr:DUF3592 domain-containing protein [Enterococcus sp.]